MKDLIETLKGIREGILLGGGPARFDKQHNAGKLTVRERIDLLLDPVTWRRMKSR